jgi:hypothetical protein
MSITFSNVASITIPEGDVVKISVGEIVLWEKKTERWDYILLPYNGSEEGEITALVFPVNAGDTVTLRYYLTKSQGYIYDGRNVGLQYYGSVDGGSNPMNGNEIGIETTIQITARSAGNIGISCSRNESSASGALSQYQTDRLFGKYMKVRVN